jgi:proline iminopeptidase
MNMSDFPQEVTKSGYIQLLGARTRYFREGTGQLCLVIGDVLYYPRTFSSALLADLELVHIDTRLTVPSETHLRPESLTIDMLIDDIEVTRQKLDLAQFIVVGHSMYGVFALEYARRYPEHVAGVIAIATPPIFDQQRDVLVEAYWEKHASPERKSILAQNLAAWSKLNPADQSSQRFLAQAPEYWHNPMYDPSRLLEGFYVNDEVMNHLYTNLAQNINLFHADNIISAPVLLILGRDDYVVPPVLWDQKQSAIPQLTTHIFQHSGHTPQLEEPAKFNQIILDWIADRQNEPIHTTIQ